MNAMACNMVSNGTYCASESCPIAVAETATDAASFIYSYTDITIIQFLSWNPFIDRNMIAEGEVVCIGYVAFQNFSH